MDEILVVLEFPFILSYESATDSKNDSKWLNASLDIKRKDLLTKFLSKEGLTDGII